MGNVTKVLQTTLESFANRSASAQMMISNLFSGGRSTYLVVAILAIALAFIVWRRSRHLPKHSKRIAVDDTAGRVGIAKRLRLFLNVVLIVTLLIVVKLAVHAAHLEFMTLDTLFSSIVASAIFIIGFLLTSILPDYKEAERIPAELRTALEAIYDDVTAFSRRVSGVDIANLRAILSHIVSALDAGLGTEGGHSHVEGAVAQADRLAAYFAELEQLGMSQNFVVRLRHALDSLRRCLYRIHYIQKVEFVPSVEVLIQTLVAAVLFLLLSLKTDGSYGAAFIFGFISYLFVYSMHLIAVFQQPFRQGSRSVDKVDLFLLRDFVKKIES